MCLYFDHSFDLFLSKARGGGIPLAWLSLFRHQQTARKRIHCNMSIAVSNADWFWYVGLTIITSKLSLYYYFSYEYINLLLVLLIDT